VLSFMAQLLPRRRLYRCPSSRESWDSAGQLRAHGMASAENLSYQPQLASDLVTLASGYCGVANTARADPSSLWPEWAAQ